MLENFTDCILISVDRRKKFGQADNTVLLVGRKKLNKGVEIINAFEGDEALELYKKLIKDGSENAKD